MEIDSQKIRLLRSYSRMTITSTTSIHDTCTSASGLEFFLPRTSTPQPDSVFYIDNEDCFDPYEIFRTILEIPPKRATVRGLQKVPHHFITGHLVQLQKNENFDYTSISLNSSAKNVESLKAKFSSFKKALKNFFRKHYKNLIRNKCDYSVCPVTCECQKVKSFLNKTIVLDDEVDG